MRHLLLTQAHKRRMFCTQANYEPDCLCRNGSFHAVKVEQVEQVDCPVCLEIIATDPEYLRS